MATTELQSAVPMCKHHTKEELDSYCFTCKFRICEECCRGEHKDHNWRRSKKAAREIRENSHARCEKIEGMISGLEQNEEDRETEDDIERIDKLKMEFISFIDDLAEEMKAKRRVGKSQRNLTKELEKLRKMLNFYKNEVKLVKDNVILEVEEELHILQENISSLSIQLGKKKLKFREGKLSPDVLQYIFGDVVDDKSESKVKVIEKSHFTHVDDSTFIKSIVPVTCNEALVCRLSSTQIDHVDMTGRVIKERKLPTACEDFTMMDNDIIYTRFGDKIIRRLSSSGKASDVISTAPLHPCGISTSRDGGILVTLCDCYPTDITTSSKGDILQITSTGGITQRYGHTEGHTDKVLMNPRRVAQNVNMDLCVVDVIDKELKTRLVVLSIKGHRKFSFIGQPSLKEKFSSDDVVCDHRGRILVTDFYNHAVHLLSEDGHFLELILTEQSPLWRPRCMGLHGDTLWVGCSKGVVRVYEYKEEDDKE
ncbi:hypothetical protein FSP39_015189 [Pinctada imbricata]|uniref:B box-type domain-containing protein n=1 Tax=Pinctada imbricata TaxID=66713 RepID=A0AA89C4Y9_PINIB|nr:hypothetical protein FSP39_015189 [Pinctada imbricata]